MKHLVLSAILIYMLPVSVHAQVLENFKSHTEYLASDNLNGRGTGSSDIRLAADYIARQFESIGLQPVSEASYFQRFSIPEYEELESNVIGIILAAGPTDRSIVFTAHYDAYGFIEVEGGGDGIHNGAQDNAIGVAALIELARMFSDRDPPAQNLVFIATAGEELGSHGSRYYVENPSFPASEISINLNIDGFNISGPRADFFVMPRQGVDFVDEIERAAGLLGWSYLSPDWIDGMNASFDTSRFLELGIPAVTIWTGNTLKTGEAANPPRLGRIHTPDDEISELWNWDGVEDHLALYEAVADYFLAHPDGITVTDPSLFAQ